MEGDEKMNAKFTKVILQALLALSIPATVIAAPNTHANCQATKSCGGVTLPNVNTPTLPEIEIGQLVGNFCERFPQVCFMPERPTPEIDRDKIQNLIGFLQGQEKPGWDPLPPVIEPEMEDSIAILQNYQRVETPNAEELLKRSKKTTRGSKGPKDVSE